MSSYAFYLISAVVVVSLVGFVGFYAYRLGSARKKIEDDPSARLGQLLRSVDVPPTRSLGVSDGERRSAVIESRGPRIEPPDVRSGSAQSANGASSGSRVYEQGPGLRVFTEEVVFMRRDKSGEVSFQIGERPAMPLKFLLDAKARSALNQVSMRATADFGGSWAILASEDEEGRLSVTRLF